VLLGLLYSGFIGIGCKHREITKELTLYVGYLTYVLGYFTFAVGSAVEWDLPSEETVAVHWDNNAGIAGSLLFVVGSICFVVLSVPPCGDTVGMEGSARIGLSCSTM